MRYSSRTLKTGDLYMYVTGEHPAVEFIFDRRDWVREYARFLLDMQGRYQNRWSWWKLTPPPRVYDLHFVKVSFLDQLLARAITLATVVYVLLKR